MEMVIEKNHQIAHANVYDWSRLLGCLREYSVQNDINYQHFCQIENYKKVSFIGAGLSLIRCT